MGGTDHMSTILERVKADLERVRASRRKRAPDVLAGVPGARRRPAGVTVLVMRPGDWPVGGRGVTGAGPGLAAFDEVGGGWRDAREPR
jgi:hypothetical protein